MLLRDCYLTVQFYIQLITRPLILMIHFQIDGQFVSDWSAEKALKSINESQELIQLVVARMREYSRTNTVGTTVL